ncbi:MAG: hypothetical protein EA401_04245 [Planctomycetota bacterium]|nr:MAG: hypothetical protein EA401_04245 [Planctomycetota bacterium]
MRTGGQGEASEAMRTGGQGEASEAMRTGGQGEASEAMRTGGQGEASEAMRTGGQGEASEAMRTGGMSGGKTGGSKATDRPPRTARADTIAKRSALRCEAPAGRQRPWGASEAMRTGGCRGAIAP